MYIRKNDEINTKLKHSDVIYHFNRDIINLKILSHGKLRDDILTKDSNRIKITKFTNNIFYIKISFEGVIITYLISILYIYIYAFMQIKLLW